MKNTRYVNHVKQGLDYEEFVVALGNICFRYQPDLLIISEELQKEKQRIKEQREEEELERKEQLEKEEEERKQKEEEEKNKEKKDGEEEKEKEKEEENEDAEDKSPEQKPKKKTQEDQRKEEADRKAYEESEFYFDLNMTEDEEDTRDWDENDMKTAGVVEGLKQLMELPIKIRDAELKVKYIQEDFKNKPNAFKIRSFKAKMGGQKRNEKDPEMNYYISKVDTHPRKYEEPSPSKKKPSRRHNLKGNKKDSAKDNRKKSVSKAEIPDNNKKKLEVPENKNNVTKSPAKSPAKKR